MTQVERTTKPVSRRLRFEVLRRDDYACRYCGAKAPDVPLTVDHVVPVTLGGTNEPSNLVTACRDCNSGKASVAPDSPIVENVADDALRWATAMAYAATLAACKRDEMNQHIENFDTVWISYFGDEHERWDFHRASNWRESIRRWIEAGLDLETLASLAEEILRRDNIRNTGIWRYFCGAAWRKLAEHQEMARHLIDTGKVE